MPENFGRAVDQRLDEQDVVKLVDVVLVGDSLVEPAEAGGDARGQLRTAEIKGPGEEKSKKGRTDGNQHEEGFSSCAGSFAGGLMCQILVGKISHGLARLELDGHFSESRNLENRSEEVFEAATDADPSANQRQERQDDQRAQHHPWAFVGPSVAMAMTVIVVPMSSVAVRVVAVRIGRRRAAVITEKCHEPQPEHVERGDKRGDDADQPKHPTSVLTRIGFPQDLVLREKSGKGWEASDRKCRDGHGQEGPGHVLPEPAHLSHVLFAADAVNYRTCRKE